MPATLALLLQVLFILIHKLTSVKEFMEDLVMVLTFRLVF